MTTTCPECKAVVPDHAMFCHACGSQVLDADAQTAIDGSLSLSASDKMEALLREATAGDFEIHQILGRGGMAAVYLATEVHLHRKVAIKVLPPELTYGQGVERFAREARTAASLDHPHIIPIYRVSPPGGVIFWFAMKYLEGNALDDILKAEDKVPLDRTTKILTQVGDALDYAHEREVVHRDIKPANIMVDDRGRVTVTDFGIAKAVSEGTITASGAVVGTPNFMSPEQATGTGIGPRTDQYSLAVMAYQMLSGTLPFQGTSAIEILHKHCTQPPPPLHQVEPGLPGFVYAAISRALAKDPEHRFPTARTFVDALRGDADADISGETTEVMARRASLRNATRQRARRRWPVAAATLILVGGGAAGGYWSWQQSSPEEDPGTADTLVADPLIVESPPPEPAHLALSGLPTNAVVEVNGVETEETELELLADSTYIVRIAAAGYRSTEDTLTLAAGTVDTLAFSGERIARPPPPEQPRPTTGIVRVLIENSWARIEVDGVARGETNRIVDTLPVGRHRFQFTREGYVPIDTTLQVDGGATLTLRITMRPTGESR